jgi:hypothetical protein
VTVAEALELMDARNGYVIVGILQGEAKEGDILTSWASAPMPEGKYLLLTEQATHGDWEDQKQFLGIQSKMKHVQHMAKFFKAVII